MADVIITGSATIISHAFANPNQTAPLNCENSALKKLSIEAIIPKNVSDSVSSVEKSENHVAADEILLGKTLLAINDTPSPSKKDVSKPIACNRSTDIVEDSTKKGPQDTRSRIFSPSGLGVDLGSFLFPEVVVDGSGNKSSGKSLVSKGSASKIPVVIPPEPVAVVIPSFSGVAQALEGPAPCGGVCVADLRRAVSSEVWARFPEAVWKDAAVIASEILKLPPAAGSAGPPFPPVGHGMDSSIPPNIVKSAAVLAGEPVVTPVLPAVKPVTPSDSVANGPDPKAPTFATMVSNDPASVERIGSTDFSGFLPTAIFTKEECESVSAVYKNALIGKFSFGKPDNIAIANCLFNAGFGKCKVQFINFKHVLISLQNEDAYTRLWLKREFIALGYPMRLFKWDPFFDFKQEPALVPIWVKIMALPLQWFDQGALQTIGSLMGTFLKADPMTINRSRLDYARICVEINLKNNLPKLLGITCGTIYKDFEVEYEKLPSFCQHCQHIGHDIDACYIRNPSLKPHTFTNKFLESGKNQTKERDRSQWYMVGKGKKVTEASVSGVKNNEVGLPPPPPPVSNVSVKNAGAISDNATLVTNNGFAALESLVEEEPRPPPAVSNGVSGSSDPETHRGSHQDSLNDPNDLVLSSSEDDTEQTNDKAHHDGAMSDPSFNASSDFAGAVGDPPDSGQSPLSHTIVYGLPKISESSSIAGPTGKKA
ncbi:hypothetical protein OROMI_010476 [Orobanche minor]